MKEHRTAVSERLVDQEAEGLRKLNLGRDQILAWLWELANLSLEATRGIIAGQVKALSMIVAIEGLIQSDRMIAASLHPKRNTRPRPSRHKSQLSVALRTAASSRWRGARRCSCSRGNPTSRAIKKKKKVKKK